MTKSIRPELKFLCAFAAACIVLLSGLLLSAPIFGWDHVAAPSRYADDPAWYPDLAGFKVPEIVDQDLFYHNIGHSIENARKADIIIVGSSFSSYAFDQNLLKKELEDKYNLRVFNMSFVAIGNGEFTRLIAERWDLHPRLWIINANDGFFNRDLVVGFFDYHGIIGATQKTYLGSFLNVMRIDLKWAIEDLQAWITGKPQPSEMGFYRNARTGQWDATSIPKFNSENGTVIKIIRDQNCPVEQETVDTARFFLKSLGSRVVLTLVPYPNYCPQQARELASALNLELITPPDTNFTTWDGGSHMDHKGAVAFTSYFIDALEKSPTFAEVLKSKNQAGSH